VNDEWRRAGSEIFAFYFFGDYIALWKTHNCSHDIAIRHPVGSLSAQVANPELDACRSTGLIALREHNPGIKDVSFDVDGMTVAKANTKVED
jgi:hypothetical protein